MGEGSFDTTGPGRGYRLSACSCPAGGQNPMRTRINRRHSFGNIHADNFRSRWTRLRRYEGGNHFPCPGADRAVAPRVRRRETTAAPTSANDAGQHYAAWTGSAAAGRRILGSHLRHLNRWDFVSPYHSGRASVFDGAVSAGRARSAGPRCRGTSLDGGGTVLDYCWPVPNDSAVIVAA